MVKIELEFECIAPNGECVYQSHDCIDDIEEEEPFICEYFRATRKEVFKK